MNKNIIEIEYGTGGCEAEEFLKDFLLQKLKSIRVQRQRDASLITVSGGSRLAVATQSTNVQPLFFYGGNIGSLAVIKAVNAISVQGATPLYLTLALKIEEGFSLEKFEKILDSIVQAANECAIEIVHGDTHVLEKGSIKGLSIDITAIGAVAQENDFESRQVRDSDIVLVNGPIAEHGAAVLASRENYLADQPLKSDMISIHRVVREIAAMEGVKRLRDIGRGGIARSLKSLARDVSMCLSVERNALPLRTNVAEYCRNNNFDPLYLPSAGKFIAIVSPSVVESIKSKWRLMGNNSSVFTIGKVLAVPRNEAQIIIEGEIQKLTLPPLKKFVRLQ